MEEEEFKNLSNIEKRFEEFPDLIAEFFDEGIKKG